MLNLKRRAATAVLVASLATPATAAASQDLRNPDRQAPAVQTQDLRNPDRRAPVVQTQDLRNPDRRSTPPVQVAPIEIADPISAPAGGFDWGDAAVGAAGAIGALAIVAGLAMAVVGRRRHVGASA